MALDFSNIKEFSINGTDIKSIDINNVRVWEKASPVPPTPPGPVDQYTKFFVEDVSGSANTLRISQINTNPSPLSITVEKSTDGVNWTSMGTTSSAGITATIPANGRLYLRSTATRFCGNVVNCSGRFNVGGNAMSLLYGSSFTGNETTFPSGGEYTFMDLFYNDTNLVSAGDLILPATTVLDGSYYMMFSGCTALTTAPVLPATTVSAYSYKNLFYGCTSLATAPALPATTLGENCYEYMFYNCTSLTTAPELPATYLRSYCYYNMFYGCSRLNYVKCLAHTTQNVNATQNWLYGVSSTGTFERSRSYNWSRGVSGIPTNWTVTPDFGLPFYIENIGNSTLTLTIYTGNTSKYTPLNNIRYSSDNSTWSSTFNVSRGSTDSRITVQPNQRVYIKAGLAPGSTGTGLNIAVEFKVDQPCNVGGYITSLNSGDVYESQTVARYIQRLFYNQTNIVSAENLIIPYTDLTNATSYAYRYMFYGCTGLTKAPELPATTLCSSCYYGMFQGCTSLTTAPELPATTLITGSYRNMFNGCTSLNSIKCLAEDVSASNCTTNWTSNVSSTGTFTKATSMSSWTTGANGIPSGWTVVNG